jgi:hypothetical protein
MTMAIKSTNESFLERMLAGAEQEFGSNAPVTRNIREQLRAEREAAPSAYQQFLVGARNQAEARLIL